MVVQTAKNTNAEAADALGRTYLPLLFCASAGCKPLFLQLQVAVDTDAEGVASLSCPCPFVSAGCKTLSVQLFVHDAGDTDAEPHDAGCRVHGCRKRCLTSLCVRWMQKDAENTDAEATDAESGALTDMGDEEEAEADAVLPQRKPKKAKASAVVSVLLWLLGAMFLSGTAPEKVKAQACKCCSPEGADTVAPQWRPKNTKAGANVSTILAALSGDKDGSANAGAVELHACKQQLLSRSASLDIPLLQCLDTRTCMRCMVHASLPTCLNIWHLVSGSVHEACLYL
eukprot:1150868-Pelagomonas_calceolata.AAC.1